MESDRGSFSSWAAGCQADLLRTAVLLTGDHHRAEDLVQEALIKVALRWRRLRRENPDAYARRVLVHDNISWWRRHRRESLREATPGSLPSTDGSVDRRIMLREALAQLTPRQRSVVVLRYYEDLSESQTAELMGVSIGTVKSQTHLALHRLRERAPELAELLEESP
jgi:RNA polymerase sigma-70 factor (sigma-E family)